MKCCLLLFYKRLTANVQRYDVMLKSIWIIIGLSYIAAQIANLVECRPFHLYWQVLPSPGGCEEAPLQLFVVGESPTYGIKLEI